MISLKDNFKYSMNIRKLQIEDSDGSGGGDSDDSGGNGNNEDNIVF